MTVENDFLPYATAGGALVMSQASYATAAPNGVGNGIADPSFANKSWRQSSLIAAMIAQFIVDQTGQPAIDDGTIATLEANLATAIKTVSPSVVGSMRGLSGSAAGGTATASWTAKELVVETALGGTAYKGASLSLSFNGATTGAGGMDTGAMPTSGDLSIYAIYNPTSNTWSTLGCLGSTSNGPVYSGTHMPAGYTASALIWAGVTDGSAHIQKFAQRDRTIWLNNVQFVNSGSFTTTPTSVSLSTVIPAAAVAVSGSMSITSGVSNSLFIAADANGLGQQQTGASSPPTAGAPGVFGLIPLVTAQTLYFSIGGNTATVIASVDSYVI